jgi:hypothetical protein
MASVVSLACAGRPAGATAVGVQRASHEREDDNESTAIGTSSVDDTLAVAPEPEKQ